MGRTGDRFEMPGGAGTYVLTRSTADTNGELVEFEWILPGGAFAPPPHVHPRQVEEYEVLEGVLDVMIDGERRSLTEGQSASVPIGTVHTFARPARPVRVRNVHRPAVGFEDYIERIYRLTQERGIRSVKNPRLPLYLAMVWREYPDTLVAARRRDRLAMAGLARVGSLLGLAKHLPPKAADAP
jgi:mannose-6-phosphate isomerase-like protein (cupin superfamily)